MAVELGQVGVRLIERFDCDLAAGGWPRWKRVTCAPGCWPTTRSSVEQAVSEAAKSIAETRRKGAFIPVPHR
jgi:hypothetical protein